jgi:transcriptional regulator with XRE-family HTH domain
MRTVPPWQNSLRAWVQYEHKGNKTHAAADLGVTIVTLRALLCSEARVPQPRTIQRIAKVTGLPYGRLMADREIVRLRLSWAQADALLKAAEDFEKRLESPDLAPPDLVEAVMKLRRRVRRQYRE